MSVGSVLIYIQQDSSLRRGYAVKSLDDETHLQIFCRILAGKQNDTIKPAILLEQGIQLSWEDVYDYVNPFGDRRGDAFHSVWTFDFRKDIIFLTKDAFFSAPLSLAYAGSLSITDFKPLKPPSSTVPSGTPPRSYWKPTICPSPRNRAFLGRILRDFTYTWRHVLRRPMNAVTFRKLAYAMVWISNMEFSILERMGFDYITSGGPYVKLADLPQWDTPNTTLFQVGSSWVVLTQDTMEGMERAQHHSNNSITKPVIYIALTLRYIVLGNLKNGKLQWTKAEAFLDGPDSVSNDAIDMLIWASHMADAEPQPTALTVLPTEVLDRILIFATDSSVASAKLGCQLSLGSPFSWVEEGVKFRVEATKKHRFENSPVEYQIIFNGTMSGLSYKREHGYRTVYSSN